MREHWLAHHIANRKDRRFCSPPLSVHFDEPLLINADTRGIEPWNHRVRSAPDRDQHTVERLFLRRDVAIKDDPEPAGRLRHVQHLRVQHDGGKQLFDPLVQDVHEVAIGAWEQS